MSYTEAQKSLRARRRSRASVSGGPVDLTGTAPGTGRLARTRGASIGSASNTVGISELADEMSVSTAASASSLSAAGPVEAVNSLLSKISSSTSSPTQPTQAPQSSSDSAGTPSDPPSVGLERSISVDSQGVPTVLNEEDFSRWRSELPPLNAPEISAAEVRTPERSSQDRRPTDSTVYDLGPFLTHFSVSLCFLFCVATEPHHGRRGIPDATTQLPHQPHSVAALHPKSARDRRLHQHRLCRDPHLLQGPRGHSRHTDL